MNNYELDQFAEAKLLGVHISEEISWVKNRKEICKKAYSRIGMPSKLKYAGIYSKSCTGSNFWPKLHII